MQNFHDSELLVLDAVEESSDYHALVQKITQLSDEGNSYATYYLGTLYEDGVGVEQSNTTALSHYVLADQMGLPQAKYQMGVICEFGRCGVSQSYEVASKIYQEAADLGHSDAQLQLGGLYERGYGVEKNYVTAAHYYRLASDGDNARAKFLLSDFYIKGLGVTKSVTDALKLLHQAAKLGHGFSQLILALRYRYGEDLPIDYEKAYAYADLAVNSAVNDTDKTAAVDLRDQIFMLLSDQQKKDLFD